MAGLDDLRIDRRAGERRRSPAWIIVPVAILILLALVLLAFWRAHAGTVQVRTVTVHEVANGGARTVLNGSGYVVARREATVSSKVTGKIVEVLIEEGMKVEEGQVLARLDASNVSANLSLAQAELTAYRSALEETRVRLDEAQKELKRIQQLAVDRVASDADLDRAQAQVNSLKARLDKQQTDVAVAAQQVAVWQQQADDTVIRAPFSGVVVSKDAQPGEMISPVSAGGGYTRTGICTIVDMASLEIEVDVNESFINRVEAGQEVEATLDAYPEWKIPCKVIAIIPTADRQKATVRVRVGFDQLDPRMLPQMGVKVAFRGGQEGEAASRGVAVPKSAVRKQEGRDVVFVVQAGRAERRAVRVGAAVNEEMPVLAGLSGGERVVVEGPEHLADGDRVAEKQQ